MDQVANAQMSDLLWGAKSAVELGCVLVMIVAPPLSILYAVRSGRPYIGEGVIRFLAISEIVPAIVILGLQGVLDKASAGTLLAGVAGYVLGGIGQNNNTSGSDSPKPPIARPNRSS